VAETSKVDISFLLRAAAADKPTIRELISDMDRQLLYFLIDKIVQHLYACCNAGRMEAGLVGASDIFKLLLCERRKVSKNTLRSFFLQNRSFCYVHR